MPLALVVGGILAWQVIVSGLSLDAVDNDKPAAALSFAPNSPHALALLADENSGTNSAAQTQALALQSIAGSPILAAPIRLLAQSDLALGDPVKAATIMNQSAALGWRDEPTQAWLAVSAMDAGDPATASQHLDAMLRDFGATQAGFAMLDSLITNPALRAKMAARIAGMPPWRRDYILYATQISPAQLAIRAELMDDMAAQGTPPTHDELTSLVARLVASGNAQLGYRLWRAQTIAAGMPATIPFDASFTHVPSDPGTASPFEWRALNMAGATASPDTASGHGLLVSSDGDASGSLAEQALMLSPGPHRLTVQVAGPASASQTFNWGLYCVDTRTDVDPDTAPAAGVAATRWSMSWTIPATGCGLQVLSLRAHTRDGTDRVEARFDNVVIDAP